MKNYIKYGLIIFIFSILIGYFLGKFMPLFKSDKKDIAVENIVGNTTNVGTSIQTTVETSISEEKVSPNAELILEKNYKDCKHTVKTTAEIPSEMVNLTKRQLENKYLDWTVKDFSENSISLYKTMEGLCGEHFIITEESGKIIVYRLDENYNKFIYERTEIGTEYLTEEDMKKLKDGIYVYGVS